MNQKYTPNASRFLSTATLWLIAPAIVFSLGCDKLKSQQDLSRLDNIVASGDKSGSTQALAGEYKSYLSDYPEDALGWTLLGKTQKELDEDDAATESYNKALKLNPKQVEAITGLGILLRRAEKYDESLAMYERAVKIEPNYAQAYASMLVIAIIKKNYKQAVSYGEKAYQLDKEDPVVAANLSVAYHYVDDFENRDKLYRIASTLGYWNLETLKEVFDGEMTVQ